MLEQMPRKKKKTEKCDFLLIFKINNHPKTIVIVSHLKNNGITDIIESLDD